VPIASDTSPAQRCSLTPSSAMAPGGAERRVSRCGCARCGPGPGRAGNSWTETATSAAAETVLCVAMDRVGMSSTSEAAAAGTLVRKVTSRETPDLLVLELRDPDEGTIRWLVAHPSVMDVARLRRLRRYARVGTTLAGAYTRPLFSST